MNNPMFEAMDPYGDIDPKELEDNAEVDSQEPEKEIIGTEAFSIMQNGATNANCVPQQQPSPGFFIRTTDRIHFRVYFASTFFATPQAINALCRFLDSRTPNQEVTFCLGVDLDVEGNQSQLINPILSSITSCPAKITGLCMGMCGFSETMIWCYCPNREMYRYGALTFLRPGVLEQIKELKDYYDIFYDRVVNEIGILTAEERERIFTKNDSILKMSSTLLTE